MAIKKIKSFTIDHRVLEPGLYVSREDGGIITYDMRTRKPNTGDLMSNSTMHSFEHMFATFIRNSEIGSKVVYFGPMGCQTGFYLVVRRHGGEPSDDTVVSVMRRVLNEIIVHTGPVFGASEIECGNYRNLSLKAAQDEAVRFLAVLSDGLKEYK